MNTARIIGKKEITGTKEALTHQRTHKRKTKRRGANEGSKEIAYRETNI